MRKISSSAAGFFVYYCCWSGIITIINSSTFCPPFFNGSRNLSKPTAAFLFVSAAHNLSGDSQRLTSWVDWLLSGLNTNANTIKKFFGGQPTLFIARMGETDEVLADGQKNFGYVPWASRFDYEIDGVYLALPTDPSVFELKTQYLYGNNPNLQQKQPRNKILFVARNGDFYFEIRDSQTDRFLESKHLYVFSSEGPFTIDSCDKDLMHILWDVTGDKPVEVARLTCINNVEWFPQLGNSELCVRYASGQVSTINMFYNAVELVGERTVLHHERCNRRDLQQSRDVRKEGKLPFNIHVFASYTYEPYAAFTQYDINGEYKLNFSLGVSHWFKSPLVDSKGLSYYVDYYWDRLYVIHGKRQNVLKVFYISSEHPLIWSYCEKGFTSSFWDPEESKEVARIWCGKREPIPDDVARQAMCWQYVSGRMQSFSSRAAVRARAEFFPSLKKVHNGFCTADELQEEVTVQSVGSMELVLVVIGSMLGCMLTSSIIIVVAFWCCYHSVVPTSRRRAAGFKPMAGEQEGDDGTDDEAATSVQGTSGGGGGMASGSRSNAVSDNELEPAAGEVASGLVRQMRA